MALDLFPANMAESVKGRLLFAIPKKGSFVGDKQYGRAANGTESSR